MASPDQRIRELQRAGYSPALWAIIYRYNREDEFFTLYNKPIGPPSILEARCAGCDSRGLLFSDCSYCSICCPSDGDTIGLASSRVCGFVSNFAIVSRTYRYTCEHKQSIK